MDQSSKMGRGVVGLRLRLGRRALDAADMGTITSIDGGAQRSRRARKRAGDPLDPGLVALEPRLLLAASTDVLVNHYDAGSTGQNLNESILTPANVGTTNFGKLWTATLDGQDYAQPLSVSNVNITRGAAQGIHNVLYVATMRNSLYAIDASTGAILWQDNFNNITDPTNLTATAGVRTVPAGGASTTPTQPYNSLVNGNDVGPEIGIIATPTIDPATNIIYLVAATREMRTGATADAAGNDAHFVQRLWAVNASDGTVAIAATGNPSTATEPATTGQIIGDTWKTDVFAASGTFNNYTNYRYYAGPFIKGTGNNSDTFNADGTVATTNNADGWITSAGSAGTPWGTSSTPSAKGYIAFNGLLQMNRVATTLINGNIYLGFASHGDDGPYYGWILGYSAATLTNTAAFVSIPTFDGVKGSAGFTSVGGFWGSGAAFTTDGTYLYYTVGNGSFNNAASNFSATYSSTTTNGGTILHPKDGDYGDSLIKIAFDPNATQTNINLKNDAAGNPTPDGQYNPTGGYNQNGFGLKVVDYFTPSNVRVLNVHDEDLGSGGTLLIPTTGPGAVTAPNGDAILVTGGKEGRIYLIDSGNMGGFNTAYATGGHDIDTTTDPTVNPAPFDRVLGEFYWRQFNGNPTTYANDQTNKTYEIPSFSNGRIYFGLSGAPMLGMTVSSLFFPAATPVANRTAIYSTPAFTSSVNMGSRGATAAITGNGLSNQIIWANLINQNSSDALLAYNASSSGTVTAIYSSQTNTARDQLTAAVTGATGVKFSIPTVYNGIVYNGTGGGSSSSSSRELGTLVGYGLLNSAVVLHQPANGAGVGSLPTKIHLTWSRTNGDTESGTRIERSLDGVNNWSIIQYVPNSVTAYDDTTVTAGTKYFYRLTEVYGTQSSAPSASITAATPPALQSAASSKTQGAGGFSLPIPLSGPVAIEPRAGGPTSLVFTFGQAVDPSSPFTVSLSSGVPGTVSVNGSAVTVPLSGAADAQTLVVTLGGVRVVGGSTGSYTINLGVLYGDVDGSGSVNVADVNLAKAASGQDINTDSFFLRDMDNDGSINVVDINTIKSRSGNLLAPPMAGIVPEAPMSSQIIAPPEAPTSTVTFTTSGSVAPPTPAPLTSFFIFIRTASSPPPVKPTLSIFLSSGSSSTPLLAAGPLTKVDLLAAGKPVLTNLLSPVGQQTWFDLLMKNPYAILR